MGRCVQRERLIASSAQVDPNLTLIGGSPFPGDIFACRIPIPSAPTPDQNHRYLNRLVGVGIGPNQSLILKSMRLYLWIGADVTQDNGVCHFEQIVTTPGWHFPDGNHSFHLRRLNAGGYVQKHPAVAALPALTGTAGGLTAALLGTFGIGGYVPLNGGMPYGLPVAGLGTMRDVRFPPTNVPNQDLDIQVVGPGALVVYSSTYQTNPSTRINWQGPKHIRGSLSPEDAFLIEFSTCRYTAVGAEMTFDLCTWDPKGWCPEKSCPGYFNPDVPCQHRPAAQREE